MAWISRRIFAVGLATAMLSFGLSVAPAFAGAESSLVSKINAERSSAGKQALQVYWDLSDDARAQAKRMRDEQMVFHHPNLGSVTTDWTLLGENVGTGPSVDAVMDAFMASSPHRKNILNGNFNYVGAGVAEDSAGRLWVSVIFMQGPDDLLDPPDTSTTTTTTTTTQPPATTTTTQPPSTTTTTQPPATTTTTQPPSTTTTTQPPGGTTTTTQPPGGTTTTTTQPPGGTTTTTLAPDGGGDGDDPGDFGGSGSPWLPSLEEFEVLSPGWLKPSLLRTSGYLLF